MKSWADIKVRQFIELTSALPESFPTSIDYNNFIIEVVDNIPVEEVEELELPEYEKLLTRYSTFINDKPRIRPKRTIKINDEKFAVIKFNSITVGEFIDIEHFISKGANSNISILSAIFFRKIIQKETEFELEKTEEYGNWIYHRAKLFLETPIEDIYGHLINYLKWRDQLFERYQGLFSTAEPEEYVDDPNSDLRTKLERSKETQKEKNARKWGWDILLLRMAKNDPLRIKEAMSMPLIQCFNILSMTKELGIQI